MVKYLLVIFFGGVVLENRDWGYYEFEFGKWYEIDGMKVYYFRMIYCLIENVGGFFFEIKGKRIVVIGDIGLEILKDKKMFKFLEGVDFFIVEMIYRELIFGIYFGVEDVIKLVEIMGVFYVVFVYISYSNYIYEVFEKRVRESGIKGEVVRDFIWIEL